MNPPNGKWLLVCPADNPDSAREYVGAAPFQAALQVATGIGAAHTWDTQRQKLYVRGGTEPTKPSKDLVLVYPSGNAAERHPDNNHPDYAPSHPAEAAPLVKLSPDIRVSSHFSLSEFRAKSNAYDGVRVHPKLVELLERIRSAAGCPIRITSGYRPPAYNRSVGGVESSNHKDGTAADIYADNLTTAQLHSVCSKVLGNTGGLGFYPVQQFCHVDVGPYARWQG